MAARALCGRRGCDALAGRDGRLPLCGRVERAAAVQGVAECGRCIIIIDENDEGGPPNGGGLGIFTCIWGAAMGLPAASMASAAMSSRWWRSGHRAACTR